MNIWFWPVPGVCQRNCSLQIILANLQFLDKLEGFSGTDGQSALGATAVKGAVVATVENIKGVILRLKAKTTGLALNLGVGGISIKLEE